LLRRGVAGAATSTAIPLAADAAAAVPPALLAATLRGAAATPSAVSAGAAALVQGALRKMALTRFARMATLTAALAVSLGGAGAAWCVTWPARDHTPGLPAPASGWSAALREAKPAGKPAVRLPADPGAVVIRLERFAEPLAGPGVSVKCGSVEVRAD